METLFIGVLGAILALILAGTFCVAAVGPLGTGRELRFAPRFCITYARRLRGEIIGRSLPSPGVSGGLHGLRQMLVRDDSLSLHAPDFLSVGRSVVVVGECNTGRDSELTTIVGSRDCMRRKQVE